MEFTDNPYFYNEINKIINKVNYSAEFKSLVESYKHAYIGTGNPDSKILIIGKECAIDVDKEKDKFPREIPNNAQDWNRNIRQNTDHNIIDNWLSTPNPRYNPLYPYKGQLFRKRTMTKDGCIKGDGGTSATWYNYQKLFYMISGRSRTGTIIFHADCFITEMNEATGLYSKNVSEKIRRISIEERNRFLRNRFFQQFPVVILACGPYVSDYNINLEEMFNVEFREPTINIGNKWLNVLYRQSESPRILIHTNQLSIGIGDNLLKEIARECIDFVEYNNITL